jgi:hypothetical protein
MKINLLNTTKPNHNDWAVLVPIDPLGHLAIHLK